MNIFPFKMNAKIDEFALSLAEEFIKAYALETDTSSKKNEKKLAKANNALTSKVGTFKMENKLGIYKKARLGNKFMWALRENGLEKEYAEDATKNLLYKLNEK